jgi:beta-galactosidase
VVLSGKDFRAVFDKASGLLVSYEVAGTELVSAGPEPNFWRPPTDNDFGNRMPAISGVWRRAGQNRILRKFSVQQPYEGLARVEAEYDLPDVRSTFQSVSLVLGNGDILVESSFTTDEPKLPEMPRFGVRMRLPKAFENMVYFGRGPQENYVDRNTSAFVDLYRSTVTGQYFPYVSPQENGNKTDVRWAAFQDLRGNGLLVTGLPLLSMSALHHSIEDLTQESRGSRHTIDLVKRDEVFLNLDLKQRGVGGDDSWWSKPHSQYCLPAKNYSFALRLSPLRPGDDPLKVAKRKYDPEWLRSGTFQAGDTR